VTPRELTPPVHSLPPILDNVHRTSTQSCSKGSRGLSVQPRVLGIFTETTISPDPSLRQRPSRYAIRAGRNFAFLLRFRRRRLSLHPGDQGPACYRIHRFALAVNAISRPRGRSVVTGSNSSSLREADFPRDHPLAPTTSLRRRTRGGLPRY
jgi:hypothetical protein